MRVKRTSSGRAWRSLAGLAALALAQEALCAETRAAEVPSFELSSPDGRLTATLRVADETTTYALTVDGEPVLQPSAVSLSLMDGRVLGRGKVLKTETRVLDETLPTPLGKRAAVKNHCRELALVFADGATLRARAFDDGFALRWETTLPGRIRIRDEGFIVNFPAEPHATFHPVTGFLQNHENLWRHEPISALGAGDTPTLATLPIVFDLPRGAKLALVQADLLDYPALYLGYRQSDVKGLLARFPGRVLKTAPGGYMNFNDVPTERASDIAETVGTRVFPWRAFVLARREADLLASDMVYRLASPPAPGTDFSWVRAGKVVWDYWANWNLEGVDFVAGRNDATFKYHIDFAARHGIPFVNVDWLWSDPHDLFATNPEIDIPALVAYGKERGVSLIVWCLTRTLEAQLEPALDRFARWGVAGLKIDFFDRDDQQMVALYRRLAEAAARRKLLVLFHGATAPTGLGRTYPNVLGYEAVRGLEYDKWNADGSTPGHELTIPFTRMLAGPMDFTPGAMRNAPRGNWRPINDLPMSQGTRCHQLAMYVVYDAPLVMLSDMPTAYEREPQILEYLAEVPTTWDETLGLDGSIGEFAVVARRKGPEWYVGAMTNWDERALEQALDFLGAGRYEATLLVDGVNADKVGTDYRRETREVMAATRLHLDLKPGGGAVVRLRPLGQ
jgi:alpha-glucosidase